MQSKSLEPEQVVPVQGKPQIYTQRSTRYTQKIKVTGALANTQPISSIDYKDITIRLEAWLEELITVSAQ